MICRNPNEITVCHSRSCPHRGACPVFALADVLVAHTSQRLCLMARDWDRVDAARASAAAAGLDGCISVHHAAAMELLPTRG